MKPAPWMRRVFTGVLIVAAFAFLGAEIWRNAEQLRNYDWGLRPAALVASLVVQIAALVWGVEVWRQVLRRFGVTTQLIPLARAWFVANVSRYIPGVVWQFVSLAQLGGSAGLTPTVAITSLLVEMGFMVLSALLLGVYLLPPGLGGVLAPVAGILRWVGPLGLVCVHPRVINFFLRHSGRLTRREPLEWDASWSRGIWFLLLSIAAWLLFGFAFYLFLGSFVALPPSVLPALIAINALSFVVGYVAFFAPGGLGFKEAALGLLLAGVMPPAIAASAAIVTRLWTIAAEVLPIAALAPFRR